MKGAGASSIQRVARTYAPSFARWDDRVIGVAAMASQRRAYACRYTGHWKSTQKQGASREQLFFAFFGCSINSHFNAKPVCFAF